MCELPQVLSGVCRPCACTQSRHLTWRDVTFSHGLAVTVPRCQTFRMPSYRKLTAAFHHIGGHVPVLVTF